MLRDALLGLLLGGGIMFPAMLVSKDKPPRSIEPGCRIKIVRSRAINAIDQNTPYVHDLHHESHCRELHACHDRQWLS